MSDQTTVAEPFEVLSQIVQIFDNLGIDYLVTGSVASSIRGEFRGTNDIDIVVALDLDKVKRFSQLASESFFIDEISVVEAIREKRSFNLIHKRTVIKVDIFTKLDSLNLEQLKRADLVALTGLGINTKVATAEDVILSKLIWYKKGGEQSERQWRDVLGVVDACRDFLDMKYLQRWGKDLDIVGLLDKALGKS